jgi:UMF1 family MFS transporter
MKKERGDTAAIKAWCLYDAGNSAFATTVMAAILPVYFREVAAAGLPANMPSALWGYTSS